MVLTPPGRPICSGYRKSNRKNGRISKFLTTLIIINTFLCQGHRAFSVYSTYSRVISWRYSISNMAGLIGIFKRMPTFDPSHWAAHSLSPASCPRDTAVCRPQPAVLVMTVVPYLVYCAGLQLSISTTKSTHTVGRLRSCLEKPSTLEHFSGMSGLWVYLSPLVPLSWISFWMSVYIVCLTI